MCDNYAKLNLETYMVKFGIKDRQIAYALKACLVATAYGPGQGSFGGLNNETLIQSLLYRDIRPVWLFLTSMSRLWWDIHAGCQTKTKKKKYIINSITACLSARCEETICTRPHEGGNVHASTTMFLGISNIYLNHIWYL